MFLKELTIENFKNCPDTKYQFAENLNCIIGCNGIGKTNLLDAIYYSSFCKSYFPISESLCIKAGKPFFTISSLFATERSSDTIHIYYSAEKEKKVSCNSKKYLKLSDHIGKYPLIIITPSDIALIDGGGAERRRFLDIFISQFDAEYLQALVKYGKILDQRNKLLKDIKQGANEGSDIIDIFDVQLCELAVKIDAGRRNAIYEIAPYFSHFYNFISKNNEDVHIEYDSETDYSQFRTVLKENISRDIAIGHTTKGIHRDDIHFSLNGQSLKQCGSQGQKKTFLIALTFAKYLYIYKKSETKPILLLDDLFDKLDKVRMSAIIEIVSGDDFGQIFITDTDRDSVKEVITRFAGRNMTIEF